MHDRSALPSKRKPFLRPDFVRAMLAGHSALGLAFAALIYVVCLSGTLSVFVHELERWEQPDAPLVQVTPGPDAIAAALRAGYARAQAEQATPDMYIAGPLRTPGRFQVHYDDHKAGIEGEWLADPDGRLVARIATPWSEFIADLHMRLHLPAVWGKFLVGLTGVALLSSLISGLLSHPRILKDAFALRRGGSRRLWEADLHNRLGVWGLPFHVVVTVTGALLGLSTLIIGVLAVAAYNGDRDKAVEILFGPRAGAASSAAPLPDLAAMIRQVTSETPDAEFSSAFVQRVATEGQIVQIGVHTPGRIAFSTTHRFDGSGKRLESLQHADGGVGRWILGALQPLHFGWFSGLAGKLLYGLLGIALTVVTHTGVAVWLTRRRDRGQSAPHWEKAWTAVVWGQPLAFGTTATVALLTGEGFLTAAYLIALLVAAGLTALGSDARAASRLLRRMSALALLTAGCAHVLIWRSHAVDPMAWYVDAALLIAALVIWLPVLALARQSRDAAQGA
jgi:uncharacterized iron-regulated membrane protein